MVSDVGPRSGRRDAEIYVGYPAAVASGEFVGERHLSTTSAARASRFQMRVRSHAGEFRAFEQRVEERSDPLAATS